MKKRMKRLAAMLLLGCMVAGSVPGGLVYAEESDQVSDLTEDNGTGDVQEAEDEQIPENDVEEAEDEQASENDVEEAEDDQTSGNNVHEAEDNQASESDVQEIDDAEKIQESDGKETGDQNEESIEAQASENSIIEKNADAINYVIVESPYLETPGTERIAVSYGDGSENISDATLTVRDDEGRETIWDLSVSADQLYLFTYEYTDESETGTYEVISLNVTDDTGEKAVLLSESGMEANFGVNEEYSGIEELQPLDVETAKSRTADEAADVEATVAEIDPDNVEESTEQIVNALENAEEQTGGATDSSAGISAFAATMGAKAKAAAAKSDDGNIVVALDPGHDSTHAGASSNGLREEVLTLKIANYCKEELEKYAGVTVYMTRTGAACPHPGGSSGSDIGDRVYAAADAGADIYVSLHLNSSTASSVNGSEVIIPNKSWKPQVAEEGEKLAEAILKELKAIGLNMRPDEIYSKDTTINERYPDGSISDYFSVQIYAKERGIPGIIVEHAFITNSGDRNYLNSESGLKKLGVADATGIAKYLGLAKGSWEKDEQGNKYFVENGVKVTGEKKIGEYWYYFDTNTGAMITGLFNLPGKTVYYNVDGQMQYGEQKINGYWYYFKPGNGAMQTGLVDLGEKVVYYASNGQMQYGEQKINGYWYYFKPGNGAMQTGLVDLGEKVVYYASNGQMQYGEQKINGYWYYFKPGNGAMQTGLVDLGEKVVYYASNGQMQYGEQKINGYWYYFKPGNGAMQTGLVDLGEKVVYYASNGQMQYGEQKINGYWYYFKPGNGAMQTGLVDLGEKVVYYASNGQMQYGEQKINGYWYYFKPGNGAMQTGLVDLGEKVVYYASNGQMQYGEQKINGYWYYFKPGNGAMQTGFVNLGNKIVCYNKSGKMVYGERVIGGHFYYFKNGSGAMAKDEWCNGNYYEENGQKENEQFTDILGESQATVDQLMEYFESKGGQYPDFYSKSDAPTLKEFCAIYYEEAQQQGIRAEVAFVQAMKETNWLRYGNDVKIEQYNFAGIGASGGGVSGVCFKSVREGIRAHIQHLYAYASSKGMDGLVNSCVDPRFNYVSPKGGAPYVEWLGQSENPASNYGWAVDETYGLSIASSVRICLGEK